MKLHTSPERAARQVLRHRRETPPSPQSGPFADLFTYRASCNCFLCVSRRRTDTLQKIAERMVREAKALRPVGSLPHKQTLERSRETRNLGCNCVLCLRQPYREGL